jgi:tetratricopeptide (TPR) repeat protein
MATVHSSNLTVGVNKPACWAVPFERNTRYVDREVVGKLKRRLFTKHRLERIAIFGLGGVGKTQIALELAYQTRELYPDCAVFWLAAVDMETIQRTYQEVADKLGIEHANPNDDVKSLVQTHLSKPTAGRWLLIFDNADELDMWTETKDSTIGRLESFLPKSDQGAIVFTTRNSRVAQYLAATDIIEIPEMSEHKATHLLRNSLTNKELLNDGISTRKLLNCLTFLPLAIIQAAAFMNQNRMTIASYVDLLNGQEQNAIDLLSEDFEDKGRYKSVRNPVATTWLTSFGQIQRTSPLASTYLCFMACIQQKDIPVSLLPPAADVEKQKSIGILSSYSFVRLKDQDSRLDMHRLVQLSTRNWMRSIKSLKDWESYTLRVLDSLYPVIEVEFCNQWRAAVPHAIRILGLTSKDNFTSERSRLLWKVARCHSIDGRLKEAERLYGEVIKVAEVSGDPENPYILLGRSGLANVYLIQGNKEQVVKLGKECLELSIKIHGPDHPDTTRALLQLAWAHSSLIDKTDGQKAEEYSKLAIQRFIKSLGPGDPETMEAIMSLVTIYRSQGRLSDAAELSLQWLQITKRVLGLHHPRTASGMLRISRLYLEQWRLKEAEAMCVEAAGLCKSTLGSESPQTFRTLEWLAVIWEYQGRRDDAAKLMRECIHLNAQVFGEDHQFTQNLCSQLESWTKPK